MEQRILKVIFNKSGGNASKGGVTTRLTIPKKWIDEMHITQEEREITATFADNKIIIEKNKPGN